MENKKKTETEIKKKSEVETEIKKKSETLEKIKEIDYHFRALVLEGGGPKGIAYMGLFKALEERKFLKSIHFFAGSSIGGIFSLALASTYSYDELYQFILDTDFSKLIDDKIGFIRDAFSLIWYLGYCPGEGLKTFINKMIENKFPGKGDTMTFKELKEITGNSLLVTGTNLNEKKTKHFCFDTTPDIPVSLAVRISATFPYLYQPIEWDGSKWGDGGIMQNLPLKPVLDRFKKEDILCGRFEVLQDSKKKFENFSTLEISPVNNIYDLSVSLIDCMMQVQYTGFEEDKIISERTIPVPVADFSITHTQFTEEEKKQIIQQSYKGCLDYMAIHFP